MEVLLAYCLQGVTFISEIFDLLVETLQVLLEIDLSLRLFLTSLHLLPFRLLEGLLF